MNETQQYMVVWTTIKKKGYRLEREVCKDHWIMVNSLADAEALLHKLKLKPKTYVASICAVVESTDYDTHPNLVENLPL